LIPISSNTPARFASIARSTLATAACHAPQPSPNLLSILGGSNVGRIRVLDGQLSTALLNLGLGARSRSLRLP
jgi:hypothetical protein